MKSNRNLSAIIFICFFGVTVLHSQETFLSTGGVVTGSGGTISYSVGQVNYITITGTNGTVAQGVQQPYEISALTAVQKIPGINIECFVYPNPTNGFIKLIIEPFDFGNIRFQLFDIKGVMLQNTKIESKETELIMETLPPSVYFLKIFSNNIEVKVFKIVKR